MRNPERIKQILNELEILWNKSPDQRLGQILENYIFYQGERGDKTSCALFYQEDDLTFKILQAQNKNLKGMNTID